MEIYYREMDCDAVVGTQTCECKGYKLHSDATVCDLLATDIEWEGTDFDSHYHVNKEHLNQDAILLASI